MAFRKIFPIIAAFALFLALTGAAGMAWAQFKDNTDGSWKTDDGVPLVVELFTSTNCSACMPADRLLYDISKEKNVIALGCHINYWDEHTLTDPTGLEECTYRQWAYRSSGMMGSAKIRVPHFMINGVYGVDSSQTRLFYERLNVAKGSEIHKPALVYMEWADEDTLSINMPNSNRKIDDRDSFSVWLIRYQDYMVQKVDTGQTAGRVLRFTNVVREAKHIAKWHGKQRSILVDVDKPKGGHERGGYVVIIHQINGSEIIAAGKVADYKVADETADETATGSPSADKTAVPAAVEPPRTQTQTDTAVPVKQEPAPIKSPILQ